MRLSRIELEWFRGAADTVGLDLEGKSAVVYGANGAGKSSFVDAIEYVLNDGKIGHLSHEYSGKKQEKGIINTHAPTLSPTRVLLRLADGTFTEVNIKTNGAFSKTGSATGTLTSWVYRRVVLRQDEVSAFIRSPKGEKYSALLPLLGLEPLEHAAENAHHAAKAVERAADLDARRERLRLASEAAQQFFPSGDDVLREIGRIRSRYLPGTNAPSSMGDNCRLLSEAIAARITALSADAQSHVALSGLAAVELNAAIVDVRDAAAKLGQAMEPSADVRLGILEGAAIVASESHEPASIACPACGRTIPVGEFRAHVVGETARLASIRTLVHAYRSANGHLADQLARVQNAYATPSVKSWHRLKANGTVSVHDYIERIDLSTVRKGCDSDQLREIAETLSPVIAAAAADTATGPPEAQDLVTDSATIEAAEAILRAAGLSGIVDRVEGLVQCLRESEDGVREQIRLRSDAVINEISDDVQRMWSILHPNERIDGVRLSHPSDVDKAIDIELSFYGVELRSPRLTLSEGYRNSLGLCVFLSMAKRDRSDAPLVLDDVVVSLDRDHRGMIVELLEKEFPDRQIIILTHDRDWYVELRQRLDDSEWTFRSLRPYGQPGDGIAWSTKSSTFDDARGYLASAPDVAGNTARKIMDSELGVRAERLKVRMPYFHSFRNDHRMAHEFLENIVRSAKAAFQIRQGTGYAPFAAGIGRLTEADTLLLAWGNRASHSFDVARSEAQKLIDACEESLSSFDCATCTKPVTRFDDGKGVLQCSCGDLRWRYDKL